MKIKRVLINNRKKAFFAETSKCTYEFSFSLLKIKPSIENPIVSVFVDQELANEGFTYKLKNGKEGSVLIDEILFINRDPDFLRDRLIYELSCKANVLIKKSKISKRALARRLSITPAQLYRLIDQTFYGKSLDQMVRLLTALGHNVEIHTKCAA